MIAAHLVPDETTLLAAMETARQQGMRLYTNGERAVISPCKPTQGRWAEVRDRGPLSRRIDDLIDRATEWRAPL